MSTTERHFCFGPASSFFLEALLIALCSSPVAYGTSSDLGGLIFWCHIFLCFHTVHGVLMERNWPPVGHVLSDHLLWPVHLVWVLNGMPYSSTELHKPLHHNKAVTHEDSSRIHEALSFSLKTNKQKNKKKHVLQVIYCNDSLSPSFYRWWEYLYCQDFKVLSSKVLMVLIL